MTIQRERALTPEQAKKIRRKKQPAADPAQNWDAYKSHSRASKKAAAQGRNKSAVKSSKLAAKNHMKSVMHDNKTSKVK